MGGTAEKGNRSCAHDIRRIERRSALLRLMGRVRHAIVLFHGTPVVETEQRPPPLNLRHCSFIFKASRFTKKYLFFFMKPLDIDRHRSH